MRIDYEHGPRHLKFIVLPGTNMHHYGHIAKQIQTGIMAEICFKGLVGAIGKVLLMRFS